MKYLLCLALFSAGQLSLSAAETAYNALRVVGKQQGADSLNRVLEVRGRGGSPEPATWKIVLSDSGARGGLRELGVKGGRIVSESTPVSRTTGKAINFNQLNLDSEGAFTVANDEAKKQSLTFDHVDYVLQGGPRGPVWHLDLLRGSTPVGAIDIGADNGAVLRRDLNTAAPPPPDERYVDNGRPPPRDDYRRDDYRRDEYRRDDRRRDYDDDDDYYRRDTRSFEEKFRDHFERRGRQIKRFFLGD